MSITKRQAQILASIVKEYSQSNCPVGSVELSEKYKFGVSPATIRNEMQVLEKNDLIAQPHTSAGRVPTDAGYRFFINKLMDHLELRNSEQKRLERELKKLQRQYVELGQSLTRLLSEKSSSAAFALLPQGSSSTGLSNVIDEDSKAKDLKEVAKFLEDLEDERENFLQEDIKDVQIYIGDESPVPLSKNYSLMVTRVRLPEGGKGIVGIVGPKRMKYEKNISLLEYIRKLVAGGMGAIIFISMV